MAPVRSFFKGILIVAVLLITNRASAQKKRPLTATWVMPGVSYKLSNKFRLFTQIGINDFQNMKFIFNQGIIDLNKHITLSAGHFFLQSNGADKLTEHDIVVAAAFSIPVGKLIIDDRNMFREVFINNNQHTHVYRNRIRATYPFSFRSGAGTFYLMDESYYSLDKGLWSRNRVGLGLSYNIFKEMNLDVSYLQQDDAFNGRINLIFLQLTVNLPIKKKIMNHL